MKNDEKEDSVLLRARETVWRSKDPVERALASRMVVRVLAERDAQAAENYLRYAELFVEKNGDERVFIHLKLSRAWLDAVCGRIHIALESAEHSLAEAEETGDSFLCALAHATLAEIFNRAGRNDDARGHEREARRADEKCGWKIYPAEEI